MKITITPFIKFVIITSVFMYLLALINPVLVHHLTIHTPFDNDFHLYQFLTYQFVPRGFIDLLFSTIAFGWVGVMLEKQYGTIRLVIFFFLFGIINAISINVLGKSFELFSTDCATNGFITLYCLSNPEVEFNFIIIQLKAKTLLLVILAISISMVLIEMTSPNFSTSPTSIGAILTACCIGKLYQYGAIKS